MSMLWNKLDSVSQVLIEFFELFGINQTIYLRGSQKLILAELLLKDLSLAIATHV